MSFDRIPAGSLVFVTGATGLVGSAVAELLLKKGFRVRASTRSVAKTTQLVEHFENLYGKGKFEVIEIADLGAPGAYDGVLDGAAGVIHVATDTAIPSAEYTYDKVISGVIAATVGLMQAAAKVPSVKSFVLTSSRVSAFNPGYGKDINVSLDEFTDYFGPLAKEAKEDDPAKGLMIYAASKVIGERAAWAYWREAKPAYAFNAILPDLVLGPVSNPTPGYYSTHTGINEIFLGDANGMAVAFLKPASLIVDVRDSAAIHVAALLSSATNGERLWAAAWTFKANELLAIWRKAYPERKIVPDYEFPPQPKITIDNSKSTELLHAFEGRGWYPMEETVLANVAAAAAAAAAA